MMWLEHYIDALVIMLAEMSPYLLLGFFFAGVLRALVPERVYRRHLAPSTMGSVVKAAAIGVPLPLCSCGVIPTAVGLRKEGASRGACASFLIATPQTGVDSIAATYSLMGLPFAVVRPVAAIVTSIFGGWLVNRYAGDAIEKPEEICDDGCGVNPEEPKVSVWQRVVAAMRYAFVEMLQDVGKWLVIGLLIAALITVAVPSEWLAALHEYKLLNMLIVLAIAVPMYVSATGSIPIAVSLMAKGLTPGAALVLLMAGPAVNSASMLVVGKVFGKKMLRLYLAAIVLGAIMFGLTIDYLLPQQWFAVSGAITSGAHCGQCLTVLDKVWLGVFLVLLANALVWHIVEHRRNARRKAATGVAVYAVSGMSCNHCKASVERAIASVDGVDSVTVDLATGKAIVTGGHSREQVIKAVSAAGYTIE